MLHQVVTLDISYSTNIKQFHGLTSLKELKMETDSESFEILSGIETFSQLRQLTVGRLIKGSRTLLESTLKESRQLEFLHLNDSKLSVNGFSHLRRLKIWNSPCLAAVPHSLLSLQSLVLYGCSLLHSGSAEFPKLTELAVCFCNNLKILRLVGSTTTPPLCHLEIIGCGGLEEVQLIRQVFHLEITKCVHLVRIQSHSEIGFFSFAGSDSVPIHIVDYCSTRPEEEEEDHNGEERKR
jgi:hypothetical protein